MRNQQNLKHLLFGLFVTILVIGIARMVYLLKTPNLSDPEVSQINYTQTIGVVGPNAKPDSGLGQSITVRRQNLNSITIWVQGGEASTEPKPFLHFNLYQDSSKKDLIYQAIYQLPSADYEGPFRFTFPKVITIDQKILYFEVNASNGIIGIKGILDDIYPGGTGFAGDQALAGDLAFSTSYLFDSTELTLDISTISRNFWILFPIFLVIIIPGWLILNTLGFGRHIDFWGKIAVSAGISLAVLPVIILWTNVAGIRWNKNLVILFFGLLIGLFMWNFLGKLIRNWECKIKISWIDITLVGIIIISTLIRISMIRDFASPLWVDSVHHGFITRLIQEQGSIFLDYQPYFDTNPTAYHPGFHVSLAFFQWLTNIELPSAMLIFGQALNVFGILASYLFTKTMTKSSSAGIWAAIATSVLLPIPAYLTSWGRYTHLAGMIIFCTCVYLITQLLSNSPKRSYRWSFIPGLKVNFSFILLTAICLSGLFLVHYRVAAFFALWALGYFSLNFIFAPNKKYRFFSIIFVVVFGFLVGQPWILPTIKQTFLPRLSPTLEATPTIFSDFDASVLTSGYGILVFTFSALGMVAAALNKKLLAINHVLWVLVLFLIANLGSLGLIGSSFVNNLSVEISLFPIISCFFGYGIDQIDRFVLKLISQRQIIRIWRSLVILSGCLLIIIGGQKTVTLINPNTALARQGDIAAIRWIKNNIPRDENFFISPFEWGYGLCAGYTGGYFISSFAGNNTYPQPILYAMGSEKYIKLNKDICTQSKNYLVTSEDFSQYIRKLGIKYVYIGARGGIINHSIVSETSLFEIIYQNEGVWIAKVVLPK